MTAAMITKINMAKSQKIKNKQWVAALKESSKLKKSYPNSIKLARYRVAIFKKMGLKKQAISEINQLKKLMTAKKKRNRKQK